MTNVTVIGAGLAGCEVALQLANNGIQVTLIEMKPLKKSLAHHFNDFCELVCSNSLKGNDISSASGLLKAELRLLKSYVLECADKTSVPAGGALAVDRELFAKLVTTTINENKNITVINKVQTNIPKGIVVIATGPLTDEVLSESIEKLIGNQFLHFFDAAAPIVSKESIDLNNAFISSRYSKGTSDYINCPMNKLEFEMFWQELVSAKTADVKDFEEKNVFESCIPIEVMAKRGVDTIRFGPLKPVGLFDPKTDKRPYAVLQLRKENINETMYNLVGFQTHLTFSEQKRVFSLIPALKNAEFLRYGVMHKNTYINSPDLIDNTYNLMSNNDIYFAGQLTGVEGYVESIASGLTVAKNIIARLNQLPKIEFGSKTIIGSLANYISNKSNSKYFQPMNANFGILDELEIVERDKASRKLMLSERSIEYIKHFNL